MVFELGSFHSLFLFKEYFSTINIGFFSGPVVFILEKCDKIVNMVCPFLAGSVIVGSLWWTAVTYGAITVMQVSYGILQVLCFYLIQITLFFLYLN